MPPLILSRAGRRTSFPVVLCLLLLSLELCLAVKQKRNKDAANAPLVSDAING